MQKRKQSNFELYLLYEDGKVKSLSFNSKQGTGQLQNKKNLLYYKS